MAEYTTLPEEIKVNIVHELSSQDLLSFSQASKGCHELCIPFIYHTIDIRETKVRVWYWGCVLNNRLGQLFRTLKKKETYLLHIRKVRILVGASGHPEKFPPKPYDFDPKKDPFGPDLIDEEFPPHWIEPVYNMDYSVWQFLARCIKAEEVDLFFSYIVPPEHGFENVCFPNARRVSIAGRMDWPLLQGIFNPLTTTSLIHLGLDIVQHRDFREFKIPARESALPMDLIPEQLRPDIHPGNYQHLRHWKRQDRWNIEFVAGSILDLLPLAATRCTNLQSLYIAKPGARRHNEYLFPLKTDLLYLKELADLLLVASHSLKEFTLIQSPIDTHLRSRVTLLVEAGFRFRATILPVLSSQKMIKLERLKLVGCNVCEDKDVLQEILESCPKLDNIACAEESKLVRVAYEHPERDDQ